MRRLNSRATVPGSILARRCAASPTSTPSSVIATTDGMSCPSRPSDTMVVEVESRVAAVVVHVPRSTPNQYPSPSISPPRRTQTRTGADRRQREANGMDSTELRSATTPNGGDAHLYRYDESRTVHRTPEHPVRDGVEVLSLAFNADPFEHMRWMRSNAPIYWDDISGLWAVTTHKLISHIEADWETYCSSLGSRPTSSVPR
ncbi:MAG: hypothetical protein R2710_08805 [Acidimicrobiales bacterium]